VESAELSGAFWEIGLVQNLETSVINSPALKVFWAAQSYLNEKGFLSKDITVRDMLVHHGDVHHIFPKNFLKGRGLSKAKYNQVANYVMVQQEVNIKIGDRSPIDYMTDVLEQCTTGTCKFGAIDNHELLVKNLQENCLPESVSDYEYDNFESFLLTRRKKMAEKVRGYYFSL
jgi:hypothetical protein